MQDLLKEAPQVRVRKQALEGVVKAARHPRMLSLSTHGFFLPEQEVKSGQSADLTGGKSGARNVAATGRPGCEVVRGAVLRCGLLLAACNDQPKKGEKRHGDDGVSPAWRLPVSTCAAVSWSC